MKRLFNYFLAIDGILRLSVFRCCIVGGYRSEITDQNSHITLQPKTGYPLKISRVEPGQYLDGRPPGKTRLLLEEVLVRPVGGAHSMVCVGPNACVVTGTLYCKKHCPSDETLNRGPDSLWSLEIPGCPSKKIRGVTPGYWPNSPTGL